MKKALLLLLLIPGSLPADVVYLKGGGQFTGRILEQDAERVTIDFGDGVIGFSMERVEKIVKGPSTLDEYEARAAKVGAEDVEGWRRLAQWAAAKGLPVQSRAAYQKVLALAPEDPEAREAMGFVNVAGRWLTEEEGYRARGYVRYEGEWLTPAEVQLAKADASADRARDDAAKRAADAEFSANMDRLRAQEDAKREQEERERMNRDPIYWGGWGYGVTSWPNPRGEISNPSNPASGRPK